MAPECLTAPNRRSVSTLASPSVSAVTAVLTLFAYCVICTDFVAASCEEQRKRNATSSESDYTLKTHGDSCVADDSNSIALEGERSVTAGLLGLGKIMSTNTTGRTDMFLKGLAKSEGCKSEDSNVM